MPRPSNKAIREERSADEYSMRSTRESVIQSMDMYLGSPARQEMELLVFENETIALKSFVTSSAILNIFWEVLANALDHTIMTLDEGGKILPISVTVDNRVVKVRNGGIAVPIERKKFSSDDGKTESELWVPEAIFGHFNSSGNYKENITSIGKNGFGAKGVSTVSKMSSVLIENATSHKKFSQTWSNNMKDVGEPKVNRFSRANSSVTFEYELDFSLFSTEEDTVDCYSDDEINLFHYHCICAQYSLDGIQIRFNGKPCKFPNLIQDSLVLRSNMRVPFSEWNKVSWDESEKKSDITKKGAASKYTPKYHCEVYDTPGNSIQMCFVNGRYVKNGSTLIDEIIKSLSLPIIRNMNGSTGNKVTWNNFSRHLSIVLRVDRFINPVYDNQSKERQTNGGLAVSIPANVAKKFSTFETLNILNKTQGHLILRKTDGKKGQHILISRARNANLAGTKFSSECILFLSEGDSGKSLCDVLASLFEDGKDRIGCMALKGKGMVVRNKSEEREAANQEISRLKHMLGLKEGTDYTDDEEFSKLNYGQLWVFADPDDDGIHIILIVLDYFCVRYPSLIKRGFIKYPHLPYATLDDAKGIPKKFMYTMGAYKKERQVRRKKGEEILYFKGLGSFEDRHIEYFRENMRMVNFSFDKGSEDALELMFDSRLSAERREWIQSYRADHEAYIRKLDKYQSENLEEQKLGLSYQNIIQPPQDLINTRGIDYSLTSISRSIPGFDGLKDSQRDIVWACFQKWSSFDSPSKIKVPQFCGYTSERCHYAFGDGSIPQTTKKMMFGYVGKNNLSYFDVIGQIGCREGGGKDCASERYLHMRPKKWMEYLFKREFSPLLDMIEEDGVEIKPKELWGVIDIALVNGTMGTSTGWTSRIPNFNPIDIINWHLARLDGKDLPCVEPWYRYFKGTIEFEETTREQVDEEDNSEPNTKEKPRNEDEESEEDTEEESIVENSSKVDGKRYVVSGVYQDITSVYKYRTEEGKSLTRKKPAPEVGKDETIYKYKITELPIGKWTEKYVTNAIRMCNNKDLYSEVRDISKRDNIEIYINSLPGKPLGIKDLRLVTYIPTKLFVLIRDGMPRNYGTAYDILEDFHDTTLGRYNMVLEREIKTLTENIENEELFQKFASDVRHGDIDITLDTEEILEIMKEKGYHPEFLNRNIRSILKDDKGGKLESMKAKLSDLENSSAFEVWKRDLGLLKDHLEKVEGF